MNKAARIIKRLPTHERITPTLIELHWLPVKARIVHKMCVLVYQAVNTGKPEYLRSMLKDYELGSNIVIRHAVDHHRLHEPRCNTELASRTFFYSASRLYNSLPHSVKSSTNVSTIKKRLKTYLFQKCYDLEDKVITDEFSL